MLRLNITTLILGSRAFGIPFSNFFKFQALAFGRKGGRSERKVLALRKKDFHIWEKNCTCPSKSRLKHDTCNYNNYACHVQTSHDPPFWDPALLGSRFKTWHEHAQTFFDATLEGLAPITAVRWFHVIVTYVDQSSAEICGRTSFLCTFPLVFQRS